MDEALPYRISYSAGADICKNCRNVITSGAIQIAIMVQVMVLFLNSIPTWISWEKVNLLHISGWTKNRMCVFVYFSRMKTIVSTRYGITSNVFSIFVCHQLRLRSMVSHNCNTFIKCPSEKIGFAFFDLFLSLLNISIVFLARFT